MPDRHQKILGGWSSFEGTGEAQKIGKSTHLPPAHGAEGMNNTIEVSFSMNFKTWGMAGSIDCHFENC